MASKSSTQIFYFGKKARSELMESVKHRLRHYSTAYSLLYYIGMILFVGGVPLFIPAAMALAMDHNPMLAYCFYMPGIASLIFGFGFTRIFKKVELDLSSAILLSALVWLLLTAIGSIPYFLAYNIVDSSIGLTPINGFFESMSGYTATGLTMYTNVEMLPSSILFWRSLTEWIGGVGVIVLFLTVLIRRSGTVAHKLYSAEGRSDRIVPSVIRTARHIWLIYLGYTLAGALALYALGMPFFESLNHSMTALATGGFSVKNASIGAYNNFAYMDVINVLMLLGGISFVLHSKLLRGKIKEFLSNIEIATMFFLVLFFSIAISFSVYGVSFNPAGMQHSTFQSISALTGTGFATENLAQWNDFSKFSLTTLMIFGGGYGSTASALKLIRVAVLLYAVWWTAKKVLLPEHSIMRFRLGGKFYSWEELSSVALYAWLYLVVLVLGALVFMFSGHSTVDSLFEVASAEGNVGLSVGITSPLMPDYQKIVLIIEMWAGRLEIFPVLILIFAPFKRKMRGM